MTIQPSSVEPCPHCRGTSEVTLITGSPPKVESWRCAACGTDWAIMVVNPRPREFLDQLAVDVVAWSVLREVTTLADRADTLTQGELRARLIGCLARLERACRGSADPHAPAGHRLNNAVPGVQLVPHPPVAGTSG